MVKSVFISSTSKDLPEHREAVDKAIRRLGLRPINMDDFGSQPGGASGVSLREVGKADIFVGIIARRYGYIPDGMDKAVTEQEYDEAVKRNIPRLMYLLDPAADWPEDRVEADETAQRKLAAFREKIEKSEVRSLFHSPQDLTAQVTADLTKLLDKSSRTQLVTRLLVAAVAFIFLVALVLVAAPEVRTPLLVGLNIVTATYTPSATPFPTSTPTSTPEFTQATEDELLVIVAEFENRNAPNMPDGRTMAEQLDQLVDEASATAREEYGVQVRVERTSEVVTHKERAKAISDAHRAAIVIWGSVDSGGITTKYEINQQWGRQILSVAQTDFTAVESLDEVVIRFRKTTDQAYVVNFTIGQILLMNRQYQAAMPLFEAAIHLVKDEPDDIQRELDVDVAYLCLGVLYLQANDDRTLETVDRAIEVDPDSQYLFMGYIIRGARFELQADYDEAINAYNKAIESTMDASYLAVSYVRRATTYSKQGKHDLAIADFDQALTLQSDHAVIYYSRGQVYSQQGDMDSAIADYNRAIDVNPMLVDAYLMRAVAYVQQRNFDEAIADLSYALDLDPTNADIYIARGDIYFRILDRLEEAIQDYTAAIALKPDAPMIYAARGAVYHEQGNYIQAVNDYDRAIELNPPSLFVLYFLRGNAYYDQRDYARAITDFNRSVDLKPDFAETYVSLGNVYYDQQLFEDALTNYQRYLELTGENAIEFVIRRVQELENQPEVITPIPEETIQHPSI